MNSQKGVRMQQQLSKQAVGSLIEQGQRKFCHSSTCTCVAKSRGPQYQQLLTMAKICVQLPAAKMFTGPEPKFEKTGIRFKH